MKRKIVITIYIVLICITIKFLYNIVANSILINEYNNGNYLENNAKILTYLNFPQSYIANYNYGNILYKNADYEKAIKEYEKALNKIVPKNKECSIRINYALALCKTINLDESKQESIKNAIRTYESAIDILTQNGCASKNSNNGHNTKAEQLKKDIQSAIDRLKNLQQEEVNNQEEEEKNGEEQKEETETIEKKIQNIKEEATKAQRETEQLYRDFTKKIEIREKNW